MRSTADGVIQKDHECHCAGCEAPALGLGRTLQQAATELRLMGWKKINSLYHCPACVRALKERSNEA